jgi:hypothetical protein
MSAVLLSNEFSASNISFSEPKKNQMGGHNVLINYNNNGRSGPLIIQTPRLRAPFGADRQIPDGGGPVRYTLNLSVNNDGATGQFFEFIKSLEETVLNAGVDLSEKWFGKKKSKEVVAELMRSVVKYPKEKDKYDPTVKLKLPYNEKGPQFNIEDEKKTPVNVWLDGEIDLTTIPKGSEAVCVIQCTGVYFIGKSQFGIGFKLLKARVYQGNLLKNIDIIDDEEEEGEPYQDY